MRKLVVQGEWHVVECALTHDDQSPAAQFLASLRDREWPDDPDAPDLPADAQVSDYHRFLAECRYLADHGIPEREWEVNNLRDGVWEFKRGQKRLSWFDTLGDGTFTAKLRGTNQDDADYPDSAYWWFPEFDRFIRLGHCFPKPASVQKTPEDDIAATIRIREEDLSRDRKEPV